MVEAPVQIERHLLRNRADVKHNKIFCCTYESSQNGCCLIAGSTRIPLTVGDVIGIVLSSGSVHKPKLQNTGCTSRAEDNIFPSCDIIT